MTRRLIKAAYATGPLKVIKKTYEMRTPQGDPIGRPTYWLKNGWRCGNGAGGTSCFNAEKPAFNVIDQFGDGTALAVTASTGLS